MQACLWLKPETVRRHTRQHTEQGMKRAAPDMKENEEERSVATEGTDEAGARGTKRARSESQPAVRAGDSGPLAELLSLPDLVLAPLIRSSH